MADERIRITFESDNNLSKDLNQIESELQRINKLFQQTSKLKLGNVGGQFSQVGNDIKKTGNSLENVNKQLRTASTNFSTLQKVAVGAIGAIGATLTVKFIGALVEAGGRLGDLQEQANILFARLGVSSEAGINRLETATRGLITDTNLLAAANSILTSRSGANIKNIDQLGIVFEAASRKANATGRSIGDVLGEITESFRGRNPLMQLNRVFQDFGVNATTIPQLLGQLSSGIDRLSKPTDDAGDRIERLSTTLSNLKTNIGLALASSPALNKDLEELNSFFKSEDAARWTEGLVTGLEKVFKALGNIADFLSHNTGLFNTTLIGGTAAGLGAASLVGGITGLQIGAATITIAAATIIGKDLSGKADTALKNWFDKSNTKTFLEKVFPSPANEPQPKSISQIMQERTATINKEVRDMSFGTPEKVKTGVTTTPPTTLPDPFQKQLDEVNLLKAQLNKELGIPLTLNQQSLLKAQDQLDAFKLKNSVLQLNIDTANLQNAQASARLNPINEPLNPILNLNQTATPIPGSNVFTKEGDLSGLFKDIQGINFNNLLGGNENPLKLKTPKELDISPQLQQAAGLFGNLLSSAVQGEDVGQAIASNLGNALSLLPGPAGIIGGIFGGIFGGLFSKNDHRENKKVDLLTSLDKHMEGAEDKLQRLINAPSNAFSPNVGAPLYNGLSAQTISDSTR